MASPAVPGFFRHLMSPNFALILSAPAWDDPHVKKRKSNQPSPHLTSAPAASSLGFAFFGGCKIFGPYFSRCDIPCHTPLLSLSQKMKIMNIFAIHIFAISDPISFSAFLHALRLSAVKVTSLVTPGNSW